MTPEEKVAILTGTSVGTLGGIDESIDLSRDR
jgi:hypothetical protein